jgi:molecular chaperone GrpE
MKMGKKEDEKMTKVSPAAGLPQPQAPNTGQKSTPPASSASVSSELAALQAKLAEYENDLKRLAAEFDNYKKRVEKEKFQARAHGKAEALAPFIDMAETFEKALEHAEKAEKGAESGGRVGEKAMREGVRLLHKKLLSILASAGVREIECNGWPNPAYHEVMLQVSGKPAGEIAQVLRKGYVMGEHVLRPAQVAVYMEEKKEMKEGEKKEEAGENKELEEKESSQ